MSYQFTWFKIILTAIKRMEWNGPKKRGRNPEQLPFLGLMHVLVSLRVRMCTPLTHADVKRRHRSPYHNYICKAPNTISQNLNISFPYLFLLNKACNENVLT